jgi:hypothetical protein
MVHKPPFPLRLKGAQKSQVNSIGNKMYYIKPVSYVRTKTTQNSMPVSAYNGDSRDNDFLLHLYLVRLPAVRWQMALFNMKNKLVLYRPY